MLCSPPDKHPRLPPATAPLRILSCQARVSPTEVSQLVNNWQRVLSDVSTGLQYLPNLYAPARDLNNRSSLMLC